MFNDFKSVPECVLGLRESPRLPKCDISTFHKFFENRVWRLKIDFLAEMRKMSVFDREKN